MQLDQENTKKMVAHVKKHVKGCPMCGGKFEVSGRVYEIRPFAGGGINVSVGGPIDPNLILGASAVCDTCHFVAFFRVKTG